MRYKELYQDNKQRTVMDKKWLVGVFVVSVGFMIITTVKTSHEGVNLREIEEKVAKLEKENRDLEMTLVDNTSLTRLINEVDGLGFVEPELLYLDKGSPVAILP